MVKETFGFPFKVPVALSLVNRLSVGSFGRYRPLLNGNNPHDMLCGRCSNSAHLSINISPLSNFLRSTCMLCMHYSEIILSMFYNMVADKTRKRVYIMPSEYIQ